MPPRWRSVRVNTRTCKPPVAAVWWLKPEILARRGVVFRTARQKRTAPMLIPTESYITDGGTARARTEIFPAARDLSHFRPTGNYGRETRARHHAMYTSASDNISITTRNAVRRVAVAAVIASQPFADRRCYYYPNRDLFTVLARPSSIR